MEHGIDRRCVWSEPVTPGVERQVGLLLWGGGGRGGGGGEGGLVTEK